MRRVNSEKFTFLLGKCHEVQLFAVMSRTKLRMFTSFGDFNCFEKNNYAHMGPRKDYVSPKQNQQPNVTF